MANPHNLKVGQEVWFAPNRYHSRDIQPCALTVVSIGRSWANLSRDYRANLVNLTVDGGHYSSPGRIWVRKEDWELSELHSELLGKIHTCTESINRRLLAHVPVQALQEFLQLIEKKQ